jgi:diketogulonate reductase-like aldo/keto reductase
METKPFGWTGRQTTSLGLGTYYDFPWILKAKLGLVAGAGAKVAALGAGLERGVRMIDTAEVYNSEPLVAKAIKDTPREELFVATKVTFSHLRRSGLVKALQRSLKRLKTSYVDLYQVHQPNPLVPIKETMSAMEEMVDMGLIRFIGVSNFSLKQMVDANGALRKYRLASTQMPYHLGDRRIEKEILPYCKKENIAVLAYFPLGHGSLVSSELLADIGKGYGKTAPQVALNWLLAQEDVFQIPRASTREHVIDNVGSTEWRLSYEDKALLDEVYPPPTWSESSPGK